MAEPEISFAAPVWVQLGEQARLIQTVSAAAQMLLHEWPAPRDEFASYAHEFAMWACLKALQGHGTPAFARTMFVCAAGDAGIYIAAETTPVHAPIAKSAASSTLVAEPAQRSDDHNGPVLQQPKAPRKVTRKSKASRLAA